MSADDGNTTRAAFLRRLVGIVLVLDLFVAGVVVLSLDQSRRQYEEQSAISVDNLSLVLERDIGGTIEEIDLALLAVADEYLRLRAGGSVDAAAMNRFISRLHVRIPDIDALHLADAQGTVAYGSDLQAGSRVNVADRPYFIRLRDDPKAGLVISVPVHSRISGKWVIVFARRIAGADGAFAGMAFAPVTLDQFSRGFSAIDVGRHGSISLRDRDLRILARYPMPAAGVIGKPLDVPQLQALVDAGGAKADYLSAHTVDGVERRFSVRRIAERPLYIVVGRSTEEDLTAWRGQAVRSALVLGLFFAGTVAASWLTYAAWQRQLAAAEEVRLLNAELERRVQERTAQLEAANKELEEFSYSVSHDLRSPLRAIAGFAQILEEDYGARLDEEGRRLLGVVRGNGLRMGRLIDGILEYLRLGRQTLYPKRLDMAVLAREAFARVASAGRTIRFAVAPLPPARGDEALIREALAKLLSNAVKFTVRKAEAQIEVGGMAGKEENTYYVRDNGTGFNMQYAPKLFRVFERLHVEPEFEGTGIGLAMVKRIVHRHGGRVWAEGREGEGATLYFTLPGGAE